MVILGLGLRLGLKLGFQVRVRTPPARLRDFYNTLIFVPSKLGTFGICGPNFPLSITPNYRATVPTRLGSKYWNDYLADLWSKYTVSQMVLEISEITFCASNLENCLY